MATLQDISILSAHRNLRTPCEVWTRVMGYHRPVSQFNPGKQSEHYERVHFDEHTSIVSCYGKA